MHPNGPGANARRVVRQPKAPDKELLPGELGKLPVKDLRKRAAPLPRPTNRVPDLHGNDAEVAPQNPPLDVAAPKRRPLELVNVAVEEGPREDELEHLSPERQLERAKLQPDVSQYLHLDGAFVRLAELKARGIPSRQPYSSHTSL